MLSTTCISTLEGMDALAVEWPGSAIPTPFSSFEFVRAWIRHSGPGVKPFVLVVRDEGGRLVAIAPWSVARAAGARCITGLGGGDAWFHEPIVLQAELAEEATASLAQALVGEARAWDYLRLVLREQRSGPLLRHLRRLGLAFEVRDKWRQNPLIEFECWDDFLAGRPKQFRDILRRRGRKLAQVPHRFIDADASNVDSLLDGLFDLHRDRWKDERPSWEGYYAAIRAVCQASVREGGLFLSALEVEGRNGAFNLWLRQGEEAYCPMLAYRSDFSWCSAGTLLTARALERMSEAGVRKMDCGPGVNEWKTFLATSHVPTIQVVAGSPRNFRGVAQVTWEGAVKPWLKTLLRQDKTA